MPIFTDEKETDLVYTTLFPNDDEKYDVTSLITGKKSSLIPAKFEKKYVEQLTDDEANEIAARLSETSADAGEVETSVEESTESAESGSET